jgi:RNA polymerase sigma-70 factor (ECF subfamily)
LPRWARSTSDTNDIVQETLINAIRKLGTFEPRREGALLAYLRQAVMNRVRDELRRASVRPVRVELDDAHQAAGPSPLEEVIGLDTMARYEAALARLRAEDREAIVARIEFGQSYDELAVTLDKPTREAARMAVSRALVRLAAEMKRIPEKDG